MALITYANAPFLIRDLIKRYEFPKQIDRELVTPSEIYNVAISEVEYMPSSIRGTLMTDMFVPQQEFGQTTTRPAEAKKTDVKISLHMKNYGFLDGAKDITAMGIRPAPYQEKLNPDFVHFQIDPSSWILPHPELTQFKESIAMELFAGGFGGWSWAKRHAERFGVPCLRSVSVENDLPTALQHAVNHPAHLLPPRATTPPDLLQRLQGDIVFVQGVEDLPWKRSVSTCRHEYWTISASCQSWSNAGKEMGINDIRGMTLFEAVAAARVYRPKALLVEQVKGFRFHKDFPYFVSMLHWAGYDCWHEDVCELSEICPIRRPRFLGIYIRNTEEWANLPTFERWGTFPTMYPHEFGSWLPSTEQEMREFTPSATVKEFYMHPELYPQRVKNDLSIHKIFQSRVPGVLRIQPVAMAMYGQQHHLDLRLLLDKGLHGFFCPEGGDFRWYKPAELALLHLQTDAIILWKPAVKAWKSLGNMIAMPHALLQLLNLWRAQRVLPANLSMNKVFAHVRQQRLQAEKIQVTEDLEAWLIAPKGEIHQMQARKQHFVKLLGTASVEDFFFPPDSFVHMQHGCQKLLTVDQATPVPWRVKNESEKPDNEEEKHRSVPTKRKHDEHDLMVDLNASWSDTDALSALTSMNEMANASCQKIHPKMSEEPKTQVPSVQASITPFMLPGEYGFLQLHSTVQLSHVQELWHHQVVVARSDQPVQVTDSSGLQGRLVAYPTTAMPQNCQELHFDVPVQESQVPILFRETGKMTMYAVPEGMKLAQVLAMVQAPTHSWHDEHGECQTNMTVRPYLLLTQEMIPDGKITEVLARLVSLQSARITSMVPDETDILVVQVHASAWPVREVIDVWHLAFPEAWVHQHGRNMQVQILDDHARILFAPKRGHCATPIPIFRHHMQVRMARTLLAAVGTEKGVATSFKYECRHLIEVTLLDNLQKEDIFGLLRHAFMLSENGQDMSLVSFGKRVGGQVTPAELIHNKSCGKLTVQVRHSLWGGAPHPGSKKEHHHMLHTELAAHFHEQGFTVHQTPMLVEQMLKEYGMAKIHHVLFHHPDKQKGFLTLCEDLGINMPPQKHKPAVTRLKFHKLAKQVEPDVDVADFSLQTGFFCYENGEPAELLQQLNAWTRGVMLMDQKQASPWLNQMAPQSPDELAVFIPTAKAIRAQRETQFLQAPAKDKEGNQVLLGGCLLQLGEKRIQIAANVKETETCPTQVCSVTMWKEEFQHDQWQNLLQAPVKYAKQSLGPDLQQALLNPWGRSYRRGKDVVPSHEAISVQFHCEIHQQNLPDVLRLSGYNKLHMIPKTADARPSSDYAVIWLEGSMQEIQAKASMIPGHAGFVKAKKRHGARFEVNAFKAAWSRLKPGEDLPDMQVYEHTFRLQPLPYGVDGAVLKQWAQNAGWHIKPLKNQGPGRWLVASMTPPPANWMTFNGQAILVHQLPPKSARPVKAVITGEPKHAKMFRSGVHANQESAVQEKNVFRTGDPYLDPWKPSVFPKNASNDASGGDKASSSASAAGPTAQAIQRQDHRIATLEQKLQEVQDQQHKHQGHVDGKLRDMEYTLQESHKEQKQEMEAMRNDFGGTLRAATDRQQESLQAALVELKMLFLQHGTKRNRPTSDKGSQDAMPPRPRLDHTDSEMEEDM